MEPTVSTVDKKKIRKSASVKTIKIEYNGYAGILERANTNKGSHLCRIKGNRNRGVSISLEVLQAAIPFLKQAASECKRAREQNDKLTLGDDQVKIVPMLEFSKGGSTPAFVDPEILLKSLDYVVFDHTEVGEEEDAESEASQS